MCNSNYQRAILLPALAKKAGFNLTEKGVSIVNVASTAFLRYAKIFQRTKGPEMNMPVAIITDLDVKLEDEDIVIEGKSKKDFETEKKTSKYNGQVVKTFVSPHRTLEYCLSKSSSLGLQFQEIAKGIHTGTDWSDFEKSLTEKLDNNGLNKTGIAYQLAKLLEDDSGNEIPDINIDEDDENIEFLLGAIKYACEN